MAAQGTPKALTEASTHALHTMQEGWQAGLSLVEQGDTWSTWQLSLYLPPECLLLAAGALIRAGYRTVDVRYRDGGKIREIHCRR